MVLKVGFNVSPLKSGHKSRGMGFYTKNLLDELKQIEGLEIVEFEKISSLKKVDVVHYPYFDLFSNSLPIFKKYPTVVTIPDITPLLFPGHYPSGIKGWVKNRIQKFSLKKVKEIITLSEASKKDIVDFFMIDSKKVSAIYIAYNPLFKVIEDKDELLKVKQKYGLPDKFALFIGNPNWNKNILNIAEACLRADIKIYFAGKSFENTNRINHPELKSYNEFLDKYLDNDLVKLLGFVEDLDLVGICNLASVLLLPSYYEGFGMPILEAQACGTAVITSKVSSMPEVAGKGAILVNPDDVNEIAGAIKRVVTVKDFRNRLVQDGFENVKKFSWKQTALKTFEVYKRVAAQ